MKEAPLFTVRPQYAADYDVIVAGGGVSGVAAAVAARRAGKSVLLLEKQLVLGGLATGGLVNFFVPMDNGRGVQIIHGMCDEFVALATKYGYDTIPDAWKNGEPGLDKTNVRYHTKFSPGIFMLVLTDLLAREGVTLLYDTVVSQAVMEGNRAVGLVAENKTGFQYYGAKMIVDATGDADILARAGVPTVLGENYEIFTVDSVTVENCRKVAETENMRYLTQDLAAHDASAFGVNQPEGMAPRRGVTAEEITDYLIENHRGILEKLKQSDRNKRTVSTVSTMCQFRQTRRIDGDYNLSEKDAWRHFDDSVCAINDAGKKATLYEVPLRCLTRREFPNLVTAGRSVAGDGYVWNVTRVSPPAILTGQAAGVAAAQAIDEGCGVAEVDIRKLQQTLAAQNVMIHFDDAWLPAEAELRRDRAAARGGTAQL